MSQQNSENSGSQSSDLGEDALQAMESNSKPQSTQKATASHEWLDRRLKVCDFHTVTAEDLNELLHSVTVPMSTVTSTTTSAQETTAELTTESISTTQSSTTTKEATLTAEDATTISTTKEATITVGTMPDDSTSSLTTQTTESSDRSLTSTSTTPTTASTETTTEGTAYSESTSSSTNTATTTESATSGSVDTTLEGTTITETATGTMVTATGTTVTFTAGSVAGSSDTTLAISKETTVAEAATSILVGSTIKTTTEESTATTIATTKSTNMMTTSSAGMSTIIPSTMESVTIGTTSAKSSTTTALLTTVISSSTEPDIQTQEPPAIPFNSPSVVECPPYRSLPNSQAHGYSIRSGSYIMYSCKHGHVFSEGGTIRTIICQQDGTWNAVIEDCVAKQCPALDSNAVLDDGSLAAVATTSVSVSLGVVCNDTEALFDIGMSSLQTKCVGDQETGRWTKPSVNCSAARCGALPLLLHATVSESYVTDVGSRIRFACHPGHKFVDGSRIKNMTCLSNRTWSDMGDCHVEICEKLNKTSLITLNTTVTTYGSLVLAECDKGYHFPGTGRSMLLICLEGAIWNTYLPNCELTICPDPASPDDVADTVYDKIQGEFLYESSVVYTCQSGKRFEDGLTVKTISCSDSGDWSEEPISCEEGRCEPVPELAHATTNTNLSLQGTIVTYTCSLGYQFNNGGVTMTTHCHDSSWNSTALDGCQARHCPLSLYDHGHINSTETVYGTVVMVTCDSGYLIDSVSHMISTCLASGQWEDRIDQMRCISVDCGEPPMVVNTYYKGLSSTTYNADVTYTCFDGYWVTRNQFSMVTRCTAEGTWQPTPQPCIPLHCPTVPHWDGVIADIPDTKYTAYINYTCDRNSSFPDGDTSKDATCGLDGTWDQPIAACTVKTRLQKVVFVPTESENSKVVGTVSMAIVSVLFVLIFIADLPSLISQGALMVDNIIHICPQRPSWRRHSEEFDDFNQSELEDFTSTSSLSDSDHKT